MKNFKKVFSNQGGMLRIPQHALPFAKRVEDMCDSGRHKGA